MRAVDRVVYVVFAAVVTLTAARTFYGYMLVQTRGEWSAPLDDVFIHFDYARATARGYPFQWSAGNGYSSGNTSLLYPFVLAGGYLAGFRGMSLMIWAGTVACLSIFALLLASRKLFAGAPWWAKYACPPSLFAIGALDWSLFSGMEVALFLAMWSGALLAALSHEAPPSDRGGVGAGCAPTSAPPWLREKQEATARAWVLGAFGLLLVITRPEGFTSIAVLALFAADATRRRSGLSHAFAVLARGLGPAVAVLVAQALANRWLTGEFAASGAIVKVTLYNPFMTWREKLDEYFFLVKYVVFRNTEYHFADAMPYGYIVPLLGAVPLVVPRTRRVAIALWASIGSWLAVVALNAQVRWQNERYTMPAVAWVLLLAAMGATLLLEPPRFPRDRSLPRVAFLYGARVLAALALVVLFVIHQEPRMRDQIWFFGRASRNIRDQHITAGRLLRQMTPRPKRVLVGDAGALIYASDIPGLDLIGLGGFRDLPFARAGIHGLGATLELIERIPAFERPDVFALYPSWWGDLPNWFGRRIVDVPVRGNVICGGAEKVIYRADWRNLGNGELPRTMQVGEQVADELDVADLVSEREHDYEFPRPGAGFVDAKILPEPGDMRRELFDAGRRIPKGRSEKFRLRLEPDKSARLIARTAPERDVRVLVEVDGAPLGHWDFSQAAGWQEASVELPPSRETVQVTLTPETGDWVDHHVWALQPR